MCGLYGSVGFPPDRSRLDLVAHRGPDGEGWREFTAPAGPIALGHRRLAIIDTSDAGLQPMADPSGRYHLVFNGEIYNYVELRDELRASGCSFKTETDSEVLLAAYAAWGEACLDRFLGMFAFLIWDAREKRLFAARDRFGIKPLYIAANAHGVAFGSEIKQLLDLPGVPRRMNVARVHDFLASGVADHTGETMFEGVTQLRPGCCVTIDGGSPWRGEVAPRRWYAIPAHGTVHISEREAAERFRELLTDSVRLHLRSDVPVGSCLSGGLDSSAIVCLMSRMLGGAAPVNTVSACYADASVDERPFMDAVVSETHAAPHWVYPRAEDVFARAADITWHQDEPFGSTSIFAQWCVFEAARRAGVKVMLDGQGADEQLAGYHGAYAYHVADLVRRLRLVSVLRTMLAREQAHGVGVFEQAKRMAAPLLPAPLRRFALRQRARLGDHDWLAGEAARGLGPVPSGFEAAGGTDGLPPVTDVASLCVVLTFASNLQMLLHWEDRNSMAHSIEARVPFLDHRLVEFALALGNDYKIVGADTKRVLRRSMAGILPKAVAARRDKLGFATPEEGWFRGPLRGAVTDGIAATLRRFPTLFNGEGTRALAAAMLDGRRPVDFRLWRIVSLGLWGERFGVSL